MSISSTGFIIVLYWTTLVLFLLKSVDLISIILYSEVVWVLLYIYVAFVGTVNDDLVTITTSFFLLALAGLEFCIGFIITILFRNFKKTFMLSTGTISPNKKKIGFFVNAVL